MSSRLTVLGMFFTLIGAFGVASVQSSSISYLLALYVRHSEDTLRSLRKYLRALEQCYGYHGYEDWIRANPRSFRGGHVDALRYMFVLAQALASVVFIVRVAQDHVAWLVVVLVGIVELVFVVLTWRWLSKKTLLAQMKNLIRTGVRTCLIISKVYRLTIKTLMSRI